jgi:von Willebrand factor type A domain
MKLLSLIFALGAFAVAAFGQTATPDSPKPDSQKMLCLFLDLSSMSPEQQAKAQETATQFIHDKAAPSDLIEIATYTSKFNVIQDFTGDRDALLAALRNLPAQALTGSDTNSRIEAVQAATASLSRSQGQGGLVWVTTPAGSPNYMAALNALRFNANSQQPVGVAILPIQP